MTVSLFFPRSEFIILSLGQHEYRTATQKLELAIYLYISWVNLVSRVLSIASGVNPGNEVALGCP